MEINEDILSSIPEGVYSGPQALVELRRPMAIFLKKSRNLTRITRNYNTLMYMHMNCVTCCNGSDEQCTKRMQEKVVEPTQNLPVGTVSTFCTRPFITA
jgi:hypothetical protein